MAFRPYDAALVLRGPSAGAVTSTTAETGIALEVLKAGPFKAVFTVTAADDTTGDETYALSIETDADTDFGSPTEIISLPVTEPGVYEWPLSSELIGQFDTSAAAIRVKATLGGTTPSITYGAYLSPQA
jgi:hypothetical protein